jgi:hypothetical protein
MLAVQREGEACSLRFADRLPDHPQLKKSFLPIRGFGCFDTENIRL